MKFKVNDIVKLVNRNYGDSNKNPIWGRKHGQVHGTVTRAEDPYAIKVAWENGYSNTYEESDLGLLVGGHPMYLQIFNEPQPEKVRLSEVTEEKFYAGVKIDGSIVYLANLSNSFYWVALTGKGTTSHSGSVKKESVTQALHSSDFKVFEFDTQNAMFIWTQKQEQARS